MYSDVECQIESDFDLTQLKSVKKYMRLSLTYLRSLQIESDFDLHLAMQEYKSMQIFI